MIVLPSVTHLLCLLRTNFDMDMSILHLNCELIPRLHLLNTGNNCPIALPSHNSVASCYGEQGTERVQTRRNAAQSLSMQWKSVPHARLPTFRGYVQVVTSPV